MDAAKMYEVPAIKKALDILDYISRNEESSFYQIYAYLGLPKSTAYNILKTLESRGYIRHMGAGKKYGLGWKLFELGNLTISHLDLRIEAIPVLRELMHKTNHTCNLGILDVSEGVYVIKIESSQHIRLNSWEGKRFCLHSTSLGKALLAWRDENTIDTILKQAKLTRNTSNTITDPDELKKELRVVKERGWSLDDQENEPYMRCLGAPVMNVTGNVIAAISVAGLATQLNDEILPNLSELVKDAARQLSINLGCKVTS
jgi:IclR family KDG regulon transcriptional repressor